MDGHLSNSIWLGDFGPKRPLAGPVFLGDFIYGLTGERLAVFYGDSPDQIDLYNPIHLEAYPLPNYITIAAQDLPPGVNYYNCCNISDCGKMSALATTPVKIIIDDSGEALAKAPNAPLQLTATVTAGGVVVLSWRYSSIGQAVAPSGFRIYIDSGSGFDFNTPSATKAAPAALARIGTGGEFTWTSGALTHGVRHRFCVRSYAASCGESQNTSYVSAVPDSQGPAAITDLSGDWEEI